MPDLGTIGAARVVALAQLPDGGYVFAGVKGTEGVTGRLHYLEDTEWVGGRYFNSPARALEVFAETVSTHYRVTSKSSSPGPHLTPHNTHTMLLDATDDLLQWGHVEWREETRDPATNEITAWSAVVTEDDGDGGATLNHAALLKAMTEMVAARDTLRLKSVGHYAKALAAKSNDEATDHICQVDVYGFGALVQFAVFGQIEYVY